VRRRKPSEDANPFTAYNGQWAVRSRNIASAGSIRITYSGGESDGTPIANPGLTYYFWAQAARGTVSQTNTRAYVRIDWFDDSETSISTSTGSTVNLTTANTWYQLSVSGVAPANTTRAILYVFYERSSGSMQPGDRVWADGFQFSRNSTSTYYDGDKATSQTNIYGWTGGVGLSPSYKANNYVDNLADYWLAGYSTTSMRVSRIRWNAQENLQAVSSLKIGNYFTLTYKGTFASYRIIGIDANVDPDRYMIDYYLMKI
jgi:hypothetical protein